MPDLKHCLPCKILAVVLCLFLAVEFHYLQAQNVTPAESFAIAMQDFNGGDFGRAKTRLEDIIDAADRVSAAESDLGYVYLMMGACDEMSGDLESGIRNYEQAEVLLGGCAAMIDGVELAGLPMYEFVFGPLQEESQAEDFEARLAEAMESYQAGEYEAAQAALEELAEDLASLEGMDTLRGETFLLLGASCEMLGLRSLAVEHYCQAKDILGSGKSTEGLDLATLPLYRENCTTTSGVAVTVLLAQYENGRDAYFAEDYEAAKLSLENLVSALETMEGW